MGIKWLLSLDATILFVAHVSTQDLRRDGKVVGRVEADGDMRIGGQVVGRFEKVGTFGWTARSWPAPKDGEIRFEGKVAGRIEADGDVRVGGKVVGRVGKDGDVRKDGR